MILHLEPSTAHITRIAAGVAATLRTALVSHWLCLSSFLLFSLLCWRLSRRASFENMEFRRERRMREELEAYTTLDPSLTQDSKAGLNPTDAARALAKRVCCAVAQKSVFSRVTMLLRNPEGRFTCIGSVGTDDLTLAALHGWGEQVVAEERSGQMLDQIRADAPAKSFDIPLGEWREFDPEIASWALSGRKERRRWRRGVIAPIRSPNGRLLGAIAVCADGAKLDGVRNGDTRQAWDAGIARAMGPIETLAARLAVAMENEALADRLLRAEKLAGLGQLAGGVAHALNNPLTAVLGFADLIAETSSDPRVRKDAGTILAEAFKMKATVERLMEFWRPSTLSDQHIDLAALLRELAATCEPTLQERGVRLELTGIDATPPAIRGCRDRLAQVLEHLLNNAAQAIAIMPQGDEQHIIRMTLTHDEDAVRVVVSDTGPGFSEPTRVFDPFYTTKGPEQGAGMGLSICYGIIREHGGEVSAFNLHPHGAAVVLEIPIRVVQPETLMLDEALLLQEPASNQLQ